MKAIAAGDEVAAQLPRLPLVAVADPGPVGLEVVQFDLGDLEDQGPAAVEAGGDQVLDDLLLAVDRDPAPAGELVEGDVVVAALEAQVDAVMDEALLDHPISDPHLDHQVDGALFEHSGPHPLLYIGPVTRLDDHRVDALQVQQPPEHEPGRPGADDSDLGAIGGLCGQSSPP